MEQSYRSIEGGQELIKYEGHKKVVACMQVSEGCMFTASLDSTAQRQIIEGRQEPTRAHQVQRP